jgi:hypothetical protein
MSTSNVLTILANEFPAPSELEACILHTRGFQNTRRALLREEGKLLLESHTNAVV